MTDITAGLELAKALLEYDKDELLKGPTFHGDRSWPVDEESANDCTAAIAAVTGAAAELQRLEAERDALAARLNQLQIARDAALEERNRLGVELTGARTRVAMSQEQAMHAMAEADDLRAEADRLRRLCAERDAARSMHDAEIAEVERLRAELARYQPDGWRLGLPDGSHPPPAPLSDDGLQPAPPLVGVTLYRKDKS